MELRENMVIRMTSRKIEPYNERESVAAELRSPLRVLKDHITFAELESGISARHWEVIRHQIGSLETIIAELSRLDRGVAERAASMESR